MISKVQHFKQFVGFLNWLRSWNSTGPTDWALFDSRCFLLMCWETSRNSSGDSSGGPGGLAMHLNNILWTNTSAYLRMGDLANIDKYIRQSESDLREVSILVGSKTVVIKLFHFIITSTYILSFWHCSSSQHFQDGINVGIFSHSLTQRLGQRFVWGYINGKPSSGSTTKRCYQTNNRAWLRYNFLESRGSWKRMPP